MAPVSWAKVENQTRWLLRRKNSVSITRMNWARSGTLMPASFSTASR